MAVTHPTLADTRVPGVTILPVPSHKGRLPMKKRTLAPAALIVLTLAVPGGVRADHIPGHDNDDPIFPVPIPGQEFFNGGIVFVTALGPLGGQEIHNATFDITYVSDGATPASDLHITVGMVIGGESPDYVEAVVNGSDLGFGSGAGTFSGTFETAALNGIANEGFFPPYSIVDLSIGSIDGGIDGTAYFVDSFINFDLVGETTRGDLDGNGLVDTVDFLALLAAWGHCANCGSCPADLDGNCAVDTVDFLALLANWG